MLALPPLQCLADGRLHGRREPVGIEKHLAVLVPCSSADGLEEAALVSKEALTVCVKDGDEADFRNVQPLSKEVNAHDDVDVAEAECIDDLGTLNRINFRVEMMRLYAHSVEVGGHLFCEFDGHDRDQTPLLSLNSSVDFRQ